MGTFFIYFCINNLNLQINFSCEIKVVKSKVHLSFTNCIAVEVSAQCLIMCFLPNRWKVCELKT